MQNSSNRPYRKSHGSTNQQKWTFPLQGSHKLNVDPFRIEDCNKATSGGVIRNDKRKINTAFGRPIGDVPIMVAECMVISMRVRLARIRKI